jgi:hypothetical protein
MRPNRAQILAAVLASPDGFTTRELALRLDCSPIHVGVTLSKLAAYAEIDKEPVPGSRQVFRWKRRLSHAALAAE